MLVLYILRHPVRVNQNLMFMNEVCFLHMQKAPHTQSMLTDSE